MVEESTDAQFRNPHGEDGMKVLESMNEHHSEVYEWCLKFMPKGMDGAVLDIGCGGGEFIRRMSERYPFAMFFGADISDEALEVTRRTNAGLMQEGGLDLRNCSVMDLPYEDGSMDLVTAVETYFFWPDLAHAVSEVSRTVSAGGLFVIGSEMHVEEGDDAYRQEALQRYGARLETDGTVLRLMDDAGFDAVAHRKEGTGIVAYVGVRRFRSAKAQARSEQSSDHGIF